jgi:hypothetical protein
LAVHDPVFFPDWGRDLLEESDLVEGVPEFGAEEDGQRFDGEEESFPAGEPVVVWRDPAGGDDKMDVRVIAEIAGPGLQDSHHADLAPDQFGVEGQLLESRRCHLEQEAIDELLMGTGQWAEFLGQGESDQEVRDRQQEVALLVEPKSSSVILAFRAVAVFAGMVAVEELLTRWAEVDLAPERFGAAGFDIPHGPTVRRRHPILVASPVVGSIAAEDVRQLQHGKPREPLKAR